MSLFARAIHMFPTSFLKTTRNPVLAEDLTQETFLKMVRNIEMFDVRGQSGFWHVAYCHCEELRMARLVMRKKSDALQESGKSSCVMGKHCVE